MRVLEPELGGLIQAASTASFRLTDAMCRYVNSCLKAAQESAQNIRDPAWGDEVFGNLWKVLNEQGLLGNPRPFGVFSFSQAVENLTAELDDAAWAGVHRGVHYYNVGLAHVSRMEIDRAFKYFVLADEEDERNKGTAPGDLFRSKRIFVELRERFFSGWFAATTADFHDGLAPDARMDLVARLVSALAGRYLLSRCHLGVFRACLLWSQSKNGVPSVLAEYLMAIEDLGVLTEATARMLHEGRTQYQDDTLTFGTMLAGKATAKPPVAGLGFVLGNNGLDLADQAKTTAFITAARGGDRGAMARLVQKFRNLSAHSSEFPLWSLTPPILGDVVRIQLDFATTVAAAYERQHAPIWGCSGSGKGGAPSGQRTSNMAPTSPPDGSSLVALASGSDGVVEK
ncbi:MAG: hypothetical protein HY825_20370 [Acidobacteria bacterium]|nr:hypothetical protein [Acidobacteriota bacterium]